MYVCTKFQPPRYKDPHIILRIPMLMQAASIPSSSSPSLTSSTTTFLVSKTDEFSSFSSRITASRRSLLSLIFGSSSIVKELRLVAAENSIGVDSSLKPAISSSKTLRLGAIDLPFAEKKQSSFWWILFHSSNFNTKILTQSMRR